MRPISACVLLALCLLGAAVATANAQSPTLFLTGLPCPGFEGEPTNTHPLVWQCRQASDARARPWANWQDTIQVGYGDVVAVTWFDECRQHQAAWDFLRVDLVVTNGSGGFQTNSNTIRMTPGYNFDVSYIYWHTNLGTVLPTNFTVGQLPVLVKTNFAIALSPPIPLRGTNINPPIWLNGNAITDPTNWPPWSALDDHYPFWPLQATNPDGAGVIVPSAQLPVCNLRQETDGNLVLSLQGLPGAYVVQTKGNLLDSWQNLSGLTAGQDGRASIILPFANSSNLFVRAQAQSPLAAIGFTTQFDTVGRQFSPAVYFSNSPPDEFLWTWADLTTSSSYPSATKDFGSAAARSQRLLVSPAASITAINLGFDASDGGETTPLPNWPAQNVNAVYFPYPLTGLRYWASSYNPITNTLDFRGFSSLEAVECFHCPNLSHVVLSNMPSLKRVCFESCNLQELILTGDPNLEDVRAALNSYTNVILGGGTGPRIWHFCTRDNLQLTQDLQTLMTNFYSLKEPWIWHDNQSGALHFVSTNLTDVEFEDNHYSFADLSGEPNLQILWAFGNQLTNLIITGCESMQDLEAQNNLLTGSALDAILAALDASATNLLVANLTMNPGFPSAIGYNHYANLTNRGVLVYLDFSGTNAAAVSFDSMTLLQESCLPTNNAIDPGETVSVQFAFRNTGGEDVNNLGVTLLATNGVGSPSGPQNYGVLSAGGAAVGRPFTFTASGTCGETILATFNLQEGTLDLGTVTVPVILGLATTLFVESFDNIIAPLLPAGWTTSASGQQVQWVTTSQPADGFNAAFSPDPANVGVNELLSPVIVLPTAPARLTFRNNFDLEPGVAPGTGNDGGVLEIQIGTNGFTDILAAGCAFVSGGYTATITNIWGNPLAGRQAWSGNSGGYLTTAVDLPASAQGQTIQLKWRCGTDNGNSGSSPAGWFVDSVFIQTSSCCGGSPGSTPGRSGNASP